MTHRSIAAAVVFASAAAVLPLAPAQARIVCEGQYQMVSGNPIATPACADRYLAQVARSYGMQVSAQSVANPGTRRSVCEFIGNDNRVYSICTGWRTDGFPRR